MSARGRSADDAADAAGGGEQRRRLALDRGEVARLGAADVVGVAQLVHLALAQPADRGGQQAGHLGAEGGRDLGRLGQQEVAGQDRLEVAPAGVDARRSPPGVGLVHDVVVVERAEVDELDGHATEDHVVADRRLDPRRVIGQGGGRRDREQGPRPLAAGGDEVAAISVMRSSSAATAAIRASSTRARSPDMPGSWRRGLGGATPAR